MERLRAHAEMKEEFEDVPTNLRKREGEDKHQSIIREMYDLNETIDDFERFVLRLKGADAAKPEEDDDDIHSESLKDFLDQTADRVRIQTERLTTVLSELKEVLY